MSSSNYNNLILILPFFLILSGCANKTAPTGGPRDEEPPVLISATPSTGTLNFTGQEVSLEFDEYVRLDKAKEQIIVTPRIQGDYEIKQRRNRIIMEFDSAFADNTTYTINFRESIVDITESNPAEQLKIAFSTGPYIDSISISGYVSHVLTGRPAAKATVSLYQALDTSNVLDGLPMYFTETSDSGTYRIENIRSGTYRIYALQDANNDLKAQSAKEAYAFLPDTINLTADTSQVDLLLVNLDVGDFNLISARPSGTTFDIKLNKYITDYTLYPLDTTIRLSHYYTDSQRKSISVYDTDMIAEGDSLAAYFSAYDSISQIITDTLWIKFMETTRKPSEFTASLTIEQIPVNNPLMKAKVQFNKPVTDITRDSIFLELDSAFVIPFDSLEASWNDSRTSVTYEMLFADSLFRQNPDDQGTRSGGRKVVPSFKTGRGAFISVEGDSSKKINQTLPFVQPSSLAAIALNIQTQYENYIVQLINSENKVVRSVIGPVQDIRFTNIPPGDYTIRAVLDRNNNGQWDYGNIRVNQLPEKIVYWVNRDESGSTISLRANFDVTETFSF